MPQANIVVIEDEADIRELLSYNLEREGYSVHQAEDGEAGLSIIKENKPRLVLLDLMLPGIDGIEVCRRLRANEDTSTLPIIMLTAKSEEIDVVLGLEVGADDYLSKPFSPRELLARIKAVLRRRSTETESESATVMVGPLAIDASRHQVRVDGIDIELTATEFRLLHALASRPGRVFRRDQLLEQVIGDQAIVIDRNIDVHVRTIRKKMGEHRDMIETVRGVGYRCRDC